MTDEHPVSRYLLLPIARPAARALGHTPFSANLITVSGVLWAAGAGALVGAGWNVLGGAIIVVAALCDAVDGELARLRSKATAFGALLDAVADRCADAFMLAGMTVYAVRFEDWPRPEFVGALAVGAAMVLSHSQARIEADILNGGEVVGRAVDKWFGLVSRDVRLLVAAGGAIAGECYWTLVTLAAAAALTVAWRLLYLRLKGLGGPAAVG